MEISTVFKALGDQAGGKDKGRTQDGRRGRATLGQQEAQATV